jgi:serine/threonine protein kinase
MSLIGRILSNRYRVDNLLGKGGMAEVYKVWDQSRLADMAIKILHPHLAGDRDFLDHFRAEAKALARLQHPNIVRFYSLEQDGGIVFIVMEYVDGNTLREEIRTRGVFPAQRILQIMRDVCGALNYAHEMGYIHCDIKPANIMVNRNGTALVSDFGIARLAGNASGAIARGGTAGYMSPEQIRKETPTRAADIYALGVLLFEMLTGARPFTGQIAQMEGSTSERVRWEQTHLPPPSPRQFRPDISPELERIILNCLEKNPAKRYPNAKSLLSALEQPLLRDASRPVVEQTSRSNEQVQDMAQSRVAGTDKNRRSRNILVWLVMSGIFISLFVFILGSGRMPVSPVTPVPNSHPFSIRSYNATLDSDMQPVWYMENKIEWPTQPGHYYWDVEFPANTPLLLYMGWCASDQKTLDANWLLMDYKITVDRYAVSNSYLSDFPLRNGNLYCYGKKGILEGWSKGTHTYIQTQRIRESLSDGISVYDAGDYIFEFTVHVK